MMKSPWSRIFAISLGVAIAFAADDRGARALNNDGEQENAAYALIASATGENTEETSSPPRSWFRDWQGRPGGGPAQRGGQGPGGGQRPGEGRGWPGPENRFWEEQLEHLRRVNPELADIHVELRQVELDIQRVIERVPDDPDASVPSRVENRLKSLLERQFELNLKRQRMEIEYMEQRLAQLKDMVSRLEEHRERLLSFRLRGLLSGETNRFWGRRGGPPQDGDDNGPRGPRPPRESPDNGDDSSNDNGE